VRPSSSARIAPDSSRSHPSSEASALRVRLGIRNNPARSSDEPSANTTRARLRSRPRAEQQDRLGRQHLPNGALRRRPGRVRPRPSAGRHRRSASSEATRTRQRWCHRPRAAGLAPPSRDSTGSRRRHEPRAVCGALERRRFVPRPCAQQHDAGLGRRPRGEDAEAACHRRHRIGRDYPHADARIAAKLLTPRAVAARAAGSRHGRRVRARPRSPREQGRPRRTPQPGAASSPRPAQQQAPPDHHRRSRRRTESRPPTASGPSISTCPQGGSAPEQARLATAPAVSQAECRTPLQTTAGASGQRSTLETSWKRRGAIRRKTPISGTCRKPLDLADPAARRNPMKGFGHTCHAGGRGFESRRSRKSPCKSVDVFDITTAGFFSSRANPAQEIGPETAARSRAQPLIAGKG
jgi:hypothetical protein